MRCTHCGLPLSPANTSGTCPRCHAVVTPGSGQTPAVQATSSPYTYEQQWGMDASAGAEAGMGQRQQHSGVQYLPWPGDTPSPAPMFPQPFQPVQSTPPSGQIWQPEQRAMYAPSPVQTATPTPPTSDWMSPSPSPRIPTRPLKNRRGGRLGFTLAGLCVFSGALILVFVYIVAMGLPASSTYTSTATPAAVHRVATRQPTVVPSPTVAPSPTPSFPGLQYISNGQMASNVDQNSARPLQLATTFRSGQPVYITFNLHPGGQSGAVCLLWYLNKKFSSHFEFSVGAINTTAYSYTYYHSIGPASVELYWASSTACTDKLLAQRLNFTITA